MQSVEHVARIEPTRQESLRLWLGRNDLTLAEIACRLGVSRSTAAHWVRLERIPTARHRQLCALGIPEELLPRGEDVKSGRKSTWRQELASSAEDFTTA